jgi:hypothetical protein
MGGKPLPLYDSYSIIVAQNESLTPTLPSISQFTRKTYLGIGDLEFKAFILYLL